MSKPGGHEAPVNGEFPLPTYCKRTDPSRRELLAGIAGAIVGSTTGVIAATSGGLLSPASAWGDDIGPRVSKIVSGSFAVDMHNHAPVWPAGEGHPTDAELDATGFTEELKIAGLAVSCHTYAIDHVDSSTPGEYYKFHLQALDAEDRLLARQKMRRAFNLKNIEDAHRAGQPIVVQTCEGAQFIEGRISGSKKPIVAGCA